MAVKITGVKELERNLRLLPERVAKRVVRRAVVEATSIFESAIHTNASAAVDTGEFKASAGKRVRSYRGEVVVGLAGFRVFDLTGRGNKTYPSNIDHLLEFGHRIVVGGTTERQSGRSKKSTHAPKSKAKGRIGEGRVVGKTKPLGIVRKAYDARRSIALSTLTTGIATGIEKEAAKLGATG